jgi:hypothetical protein
MANVMIHSVETYSQRWGKRRIKFIDGLVFESSLNPLDLVNSYTMKAVDLSTIIRHFFFLKQTKLYLSNGQQGWGGWHKLNADGSAV